MIGENFEFQDDICGVVAQPRQQKDKVAIWLTRCDSEPRLRGIGTYMVDLLFNFSLLFNAIYSRHAAQGSVGVARSLSYV